MGPRGGDVAGCAALSMREEGCGEVAEEVAEEEHGEEAHEDEQEDECGEKHGDRVHGLSRLVDRQRRWRLR